MLFWLVSGRVYNGSRGNGRCKTATCVTRTHTNTDVHTCWGYFFIGVYNIKPRSEYNKLKAIHKRSFRMLRTRYSARSYKIYWSHMKDGVNIFISHSYQYDHLNFMFVWYGFYAYFITPCFWKWIRFLHKTDPSITHNIRLSSSVSKSCRVGFCKNLTGIRRMSYYRKKVMLKVSKKKIIFNLNEN